MKCVIGKIGDENWNLFELLPSLFYPENSVRLQQKEQFISDYETEYVLILENEKPIARAIIYYNQALNYNNQKAFAIGDFEAFNDEVAVNLLFTQLKELAQKRNVHYLIGPMNGSTWEQHRLNTKQTQFFFTEYQHLAYYKDLFLENNFETIAHYYSNKSYDILANQEKANLYNESLTSIGVKIRNIDMQNFDNEMKVVYAFCLKAFANNFLYTPISWELFYSKYKNIQHLFNPQYILLAEYEGNMVGFLFAIHDYYNTNEKSIIVKTVARNPDEKFNGLAFVLGDLLQKQAQNDGYVSLIHAFIHEKNKSAQYSKNNFSGSDFNEYELLGCQLKV